MAEQIFPYLQPEPVAPAAALPVLREVKWDFGRDEPVFRGGRAVMVEREEAVRVWAWNALHTVRLRFEMFSSEYGSDVENLIGQGWSDDLKTAEAKLYIEDCLLASPYITAVTNVQTTFAGDRLTASFSIESVYGTIKMEV